MIRKSLLQFLALAVSATAFSQIPASDVWPLPTVPPGANPATVAVPYVDWVQRVQGFLDKTHGRHCDLIFDGDSITDGWQGRGSQVWQQHYGALKASDFGISRDKVENLLWRLKEGQVDGLDPKLVVMMIGTNNAGRDSVDRIAEGIKADTEEYEKRCPNAHILLLGILPGAQLPSDPFRAKIAAINQKISALRSDRVTYMDTGSKFLQPDGTLTRDIMGDYFHPTVKGFEIWADSIQPVVDKYIPKQ